MKTLALLPLLLTATLTLAHDEPTASAATTAGPLTPAQEHFLSRFTPEVRARLQALPPAVLARMGAAEEAPTKPSGRPRHKFDERFTARQVMQQLLADYQAIGSALAMDNGAQAAENARRLIDHPSPVGHVYPYVPPERLTATNFQALPALREATFGTATRLAAAAEAGDLSRAAQLYGEVLQGCIACHRLFRGVPGVSASLLPTATGDQP